MATADHHDSTPHDLTPRDPTPARSPRGASRKGTDLLQNGPCAKRAVVLTVLLAGAIQELHKRMNRNRPSLYACERQTRTSTVGEAG
jgi:hypothetical protein